MNVNTNSDHPIRNKILLLLLYCSPCLVAISIAFAANYHRSMEVADAISAYAEYKKSATKEAIPRSIIKDDFILQRLLIYFEKAKSTKQLDSLSKKAISNTVKLVWISNNSFILVLTVFPFLILAIGFILKCKVQDFDELKQIARKDWFMKLLVGFVIVYGWIYVFHPFGQGASIAYTFVKFRDIISNDTYPIYLDYRNVEIKQIIVGFLGWYLHLVGSFFYRFYKGDVVGTRIYGVLFSKSLFVIGIALTLSAVTKDEALLVIFLVGFFPLSAFSILKEAGIKIFSRAGEQVEFLSAIPGISRWDIIRLEEEQIDSIAALSTANINRLKLETPIPEKSLKLWKDTAALMTVLGTEKYAKVQALCKTASNFIKESTDTDFKNTLKKEFNVLNPDEIAEILKSTFEIV